MPCRHVPGSVREIAHAVFLGTYEFKFNPETVQCVHCGESAYGDEDSDDWPCGVTEFGLAYNEMADNTFDAHGVDARHPYARLRGDVSERQLSFRVRPW